MPSLDPSTMEYTFNIADSFNEDGGLIYDMSEFEIDQMLNVNSIGDGNNFNFPIHATPSGLVAMLDGDLIQEIPTVDNQAFVQVEEEHLQDENVQEENEAAADPQSSFLLIKIPEELQNSPVFNSLPSINLKPNIIREINKASEGHDGCYLPLKIKFPEPASKKAVNIIRRKPLQVIQTVVPVVKVTPKVEEVKANKRKQQFKFTREDSVVFLSDTPPPDLPERKRTRLENSDKWFATLIPTSEKLLTDEKNRCLGCHKIFKNVANHKCKKLAPADPSKKRPEKNPMSCEFCNKKYMSKRGMNNHFLSNKCIRPAFLAIEANSETDEAIEDNVERLPSFVEIISVEIVEKVDEKKKEPDTHSVKQEPMEVVNDVLDDIEMVQVIKESVPEMIDTKPEAVQPVINEMSDSEQPKDLLITKCDKLLTTAKAPKKKAKKTKKKKSNKSSDENKVSAIKPKTAPSSSEKTQKAARKLPETEKHNTRYSLKKELTLTRSAKKKQKTL